MANVRRINNADGLIQLRFETSSGYQFYVLKWQDGRVDEDQIRLAKRYAKKYDCLEDYDRLVTRFRLDEKILNALKDEDQDDVREYLDEVNDCGDGYEYIDDEEIRRDFALYMAHRD